MMGNTNFSVAELITELQKLPQDLPIVISGYDSGFEDFFQPVIVRVTDNPDENYADGRFQIDEKGDLDVVILMRETRDD